MECLVIDKLVNGEREVEIELDIANSLRSFQKLELGLYKGQNVSAPNNSRIEVLLQNSHTSGMK